METTQTSALLSAVRTVLASIGGYVASKGWASEEVITQLIGAVLTLAPLVWGVWDKYNTARKVKEKEAVAVNVGIAVADRTHGITPPVSVAQTPEVIEAFAPVAPVALEGTTLPVKVTPNSPLLPPGPAKPGNK